MDGDQWVSNVSCRHGDGDEWSAGEALVDTRRRDGSQCNFNQIYYAVPQSQLVPHKSLEDCDRTEDKTAPVLKDCVRKGLKEMDIARALCFPEFSRLI